MHRRSKEEAGKSKEAENNNEKVREEWLMVETESTEEEAAEILKSALEMEVGR